MRNFETEEFSFGNEMDFGNWGRKEADGWGEWVMMHLLMGHNQSKKEGKLWKGKKSKKRKSEYDVYLFMSS